MLSKNAKSLCDIRHHIESIYDVYARTIGISYTTLFTLNLIDCSEECTQKLICEKARLPKQTVNNVIKKLLEQGYVQLEPMANNQKMKKILFTEQGKQYAKPLLEHIRTAENEAINQFSENQQIELLQMLQQYDEAFNEAMFKSKNNELNH